MTAAEVAGGAVARCGCGASIAPDHAYAWCTACGEPLAADVKALLDNPYVKRPDDNANPTAVDAVAAGLRQREDRRFATFWIRVLARALDMAFSTLVGLVAATLALLALMLMGTPGEVTDWLDAVESVTFGSIAYSLAGNVLYYSLSEWIGGASAGKLLCGLRVRSEDLSRVRLKGSVIRAAAFPLDALCLGILAYMHISTSPTRQRLGDAWGKTVVVRRRNVEGLPPGFVRAIGGILVGATVMCGIEMFSIASRVLSDPLLTPQPTSVARLIP
jgi:uncharacterized RDD family membrane protein YckC